MRLTLCLLLLTDIGVAAPIPAPKRKPLYFPTEVGATWVYQRPGRDDESATVEAVEEEKGEWIVSRKGVGDNATIYARMVVSREGLRQEREGTDGKVGWVLKAGLKPGEFWEVPDGGKRKVYGPEPVEVPAGKFQALRVVWEQEGATLTSWYAPGIGEIKRVIIRGGEERVYRSLKSFKVK